MEIDKPTSHNCSGCSLPGEKILSMGFDRTSLKQDDGFKEHGTAVGTKRKYKAFVDIGITLLPGEVFCFPKGQFYKLNGKISRRFLKKYRRDQKGSKGSLDVWVEDLRESLLPGEFPLFRKVYCGPVIEIEEENEKVCGISENCILKQEELGSAKPTPIDGKKESRNKLQDPACIATKGGETRSIEENSFKASVSPTKSTTISTTMRAAKLNEKEAEDPFEKPKTTIQQKRSRSKIYRGQSSTDSVPMMKILPWRSCRNSSFDLINSKWRTMRSYRNSALDSDSDMCMNNTGVPRTDDTSYFTSFVTHRPKRRTLYSPSSFQSFNPEDSVVYMNE